HEAGRVGSSPVPIGETRPHLPPARDPSTGSARGEATAHHEAGNALLLVVHAERVVGPAVHGGVAEVGFPGRLAVLPAPGEPVASVGDALLQHERAVLRLEGDAAAVDRRGRAAERPWHAETRLAVIEDGARGAVVARPRVRHVGAGGDRVAEVVGAAVPVVAVERGAALAGARRAPVSGRTGVAVVAKARVRGVNAAEHRVAGVFGAGIAVITADRGADAHAGAASIAGRARVAVATGARIRVVGAAAHWVAGVVGARIAVIAGERVRDVHAADARLARVGGAGVVVVAAARLAVDADAPPGGVHGSDLHKRVRRRTRAGVGHTALIAGVPVRHEELGVIEGRLLEAHPVVGQRVEEGDDG